MTAVDGVLFGIVVIAALVQATIGVGFALIMVPVAAVARPDMLPGAVILLMIPLNAWVAWRERGALDAFGTSWITAGRVAGALAGLWVLRVVSARGLDLLIGGSTLLAVAASVLVPRFRPDRGAFVTAGVVTGITETTTGIGGPPLALVFQHQTPSALRANVAMCFLIGEILSVMLLVAVGSLGALQVRAALILLPGMGLGILCSGPARQRLDPGMLRRLVLVFAAVSAVWIILKA